MKKILAGMLYRLFKGYEFWALMALVLISAFFLNLNQFKGEAIISISRSDNVDEIQSEFARDDINAGNVDNYRYKGLGVSAYDLYRAESEILTEDAFERIYYTDNYALTEVWTLLRMLGGLHSFPIILIIIFIPLFFGRLFSDGTVKNLIAGGHSKAKIYLASLLVMTAIDVLIILINIIAIAVLCLYFRWTPPVYLPVVLMLILIELLSIITVSSLCIAALFITMKKTAAFIASFVIGVISFVPVSYMAAVGIFLHEWRYDLQSEDYQTYNDNLCLDNWNRFEKRLDVLNFSEEIYFDGKELKIYDDIKMPAATKAMSLAVIYLDPFMSTNLFGDTSYDTYMMYRDGLMAINVGNNVFWTVLSTAFGIVIFRKREIR